jgi:para-aminobenzoate synthetase
VADAGATLREITRRHRRCFWLDRVHDRGWPTLGPVLGWLDDDDVSLSYRAAAATVTRHAAGTATIVGTDPFEVLEAEVAAGPDDALWVGYVGYAARPDLPAQRGVHEEAAPPDALWLRVLPDRVVTASADLAADDVVRPPAADGADVPMADEPMAEEPLADERWYAEAFDSVQEHLHAGRSYEVNLTYRVSRTDPVDPVAAYLALRALSPAPYAGFLQHDVPGSRGWLLSASPERFAAVDDQRTIDTRPIKGTLPRAADPGDDAALAVRLATEARFRAENLMIVDLMRNDLSRVCAPGTVEVPTLMAVESYAQVHQLVSVVTGRLREDVSTVAALRSVFPPGSMTGAPKLRTMEIIEEVETTPRGVYSGAFGWVSADGRADLGVVIRSLTTAGDGRWTIGTGGGITVRSEPHEELAESYEKVRRLLGALRSR